MLARVADYEDNNGVFIQLAGDAKGRRQVRSARAAAEDTFNAAQQKNNN